MLQGAKITSAADAPPSGVAKRRMGLVVFIALVASAVIAGALVELSLHHLLPAAPDRFTYDWRTALFSRTQPETRKDIAVILISDRSLAQYPNQLPTDRALLAQIVRALDSAGAKVIGLDIIFDRRTDNAKDEQLIGAIRSSRAPVVLGEIDERLKGVERANLAFQQEFFKRANSPLTGHLYLWNWQQTGIGGQPDQVIRYLPPHLNNISMSFAEALVKASGLNLSEVSGPIAWLKPRAANGAETFDAYEIPSHDPENLSADTIVSPEMRDKIRDRIVLVGGNYEDRDRHFTPMSVLDGALLPGVRIQAQILAQLLDGRSVQELSVMHELATAFVIALIGFIGGRHFRLNDFQMFVYAAGFLFLVGGGVLLFRFYSVILPSEISFFALLAGIFVGHHSQRLVRQMRSR
jgi:adenylate cyclase